MKKSLIMILAVGLLAVSCKKKECNPEKVVETQTVTVTNTVHDTVYVSTTPSLIGLWKCYYVENQNGTTTTGSSENWKFNFTSNQINQDLDDNGSFEYNYTVTYGSGYIDIYYTSTPTTYQIVGIPGGFKLIKQITSTQSQTWFLKK